MKEARTLFYAGDTFDPSWAFSDNSSGTPVAIDLTGCSASVGVNLVTAAGITSQQQIDTDDGTGYLTIPAPADGIVIANVPPSVTANWPAGDYIVACAVTYADGSKATEVVQLYRVAPRLAYG